MYEENSDRKVNKVIVISGGANNIGKGVALKFLNNGWRVGIMGHDKKALEEFPQKANENCFCTLETFRMNLQWQNSIYC